MAPDPRVTKAFKAMKAIGINENKVKPVLKRLLKLYEKNWELIEEENYRVLADAIFEEEDAEVSDHKKQKIVDREENFEEEPLRPLKRLRRGQQAIVPPPPSNSSPGALLRRPKVEEDELPASSSQQRSPNKAKSSQFNAGNVRPEIQSPNKAKSSQFNAGNVRPEIQRIGCKGKEPLLPQISMENRCNPERTSLSVCREPTAEPGILSLPNNMPTTHELIKPKDEPFTDDMFLDGTPQYDAPIAVIRPDSLRKGDSSAGNGSMQEPVCQAPPASQHVEGGCRADGILATLSEGQSSCALASIPEQSPHSLEIASSAMGEVKISLSCNPDLGRPNFHMPSLDELKEMMEERCLRSYKIIDPSFSVINLLKDVCDCFLELASNPSTELQDPLKESTAQDAFVHGGSKESMFMPSGILDGFVDKWCFANEAPPQIPSPFQSLNGLDDHIGSRGKVNANGATESGRGKELKDLELLSSCGLVPVPLRRLTPEELRAINDVNDITKGLERVQIPWVNEFNNECPPSFFYISQNVVFQKACVNFCLSRIGNENCCSACFGNCLPSAVACPCARETGRFVYTSEGLLEEEFLKECISMTRDPQQQHLLNCGNCPLERSRNEGILEPCKGHLKRNIIKECWSKCGCYKQCGNRVVQRGISCKLQVFLTPDGKGWGVRTLEKLQKGAFVCEFVGEILTIAEFYERNTGKCNCPILLDAFWVSEGVSKDEETLCLDATCHGNIARFLNHRCFDANLIEIPVEIETPEHHYYHLAFFTTREVDALEELTWDYGIDFDDHDHLLKSFRCLCGSKFCRNMKRSSRSKSVSAAR